MTAQLVLHSVSVRNGRPLGRSTAFDLRASSDPLTVATLTRRLAHSGAWKNTPRTGGPDKQFDYLLRHRLPAGLALFPAAARHALVRRPPLTGCTWCTARALAALDLDSAPDLTPSVALLELLGGPCADCRVYLRDQALTSIPAPPRPAVLRAAARPRPAARPRRSLSRQPPPPYYRRRGWPSEASRQPLGGWTAARLRRAVSRRPAP